MAHRFVGVLTAFAIGVGAAAAVQAGVAPADLCKDKKGKATGTKALNLFKAFGANMKVANVGKLAAAVSKAQSKFTKGFTKAEFSGSGQSKGCDSIEDADDIEAKVDALVLDVIDDLGTPTCGDGVVDLGEECDGTDDDACACDGSCLADCTCFGFTQLAFTTGTASGACGRINDDSAGTGTDLTPYGGSAAQLDCGTLYIGGGQSAQPPAPTPDGSTSIFNVACGNPTTLTLSATTSTDTGSNRDCTSPGCFFGPPLPIPNSSSPAVSTCVINSIASSPAAGGSLDAIAGMSTTTLPLTVRVRVTGDLQPSDPGTQPCPTCTGSTCDSGANSGGACTTTTSLLTSHDCLPAETPLAPFAVDLSPLTTGNAMKTAGAGDGNFCGPTPGQRSAGAFGVPTANFIETLGAAAGDLTGGASLGTTQASVFCIPKSGSALVDSVADLPGPGAVTLKGSNLLTP